MINNFIIYEVATCCCYGWFSLCCHFNKKCGSTKQLCVHPYMCTHQEWEWWWWLWQKTLVFFLALILKVNIVVSSWSKMILTITEQHHLIMLHSKELEEKAKNMSFGNLFRKIYNTRTLFFLLILWANISTTVVLLLLVLVLVLPYADYDHWNCLHYS